MSTLFLVCQIVLGAYFFFAGVKHFTKAKDLIGYASFKKVPMPAAAVYASGVVLVLGGLGIATQQQLFWSYSLLAITLVAFAVTIHTFWNVSDAQAKMQDTIQFQKNIAIAAALLMLLAK